MAMHRERERERKIYIYKYIYIYIIKGSLGGETSVLRYGLLECQGKS